MRYSDAPEDFGDPFGDGPRSVATVILDGHTLMLLGGLVVLGLLLCAVFYGLTRSFARARLEARRKASAKAIYDSINLALLRAVHASGAIQIEYARELSATVEARLGSLLVLKDKSGKLFEDLAKAVDEPDPVPGEVKPEKPTKVKADMTADEHRVAVWQALQGFHAVWSDETAVLGLIEGAQAELSRSRSAAHALQHLSRGTPAPATPTPPKSRPKSRKSKAVSDTVVVTVDAPAAVSGADDLPPLPPGPAKGKLAKHKKNMLA
ncbi:hypothetical protein PQU92_03335 [Asticcacaulis sp. BYS171W]|uniref:Uncharacterized protein n=1 Tax=Asticcacaulis aquaticus TaxID=2984212 RepID=A0ABT5HQG8_9CAUL|nr:hypothetical protein [Asticcacaulis aquaticus]MDC7682291.1 hypothetical protein [Asticcacaulis aquaticus]